MSGFTAYLTSLWHQFLAIHFYDALVDQRHRRFVAPNFRRGAEASDGAFVFADVHLDD